MVLGRLNQDQGAGAGGQAVRRGAGKVFAGNRGRSSLIPRPVHRPALGFKAYRVNLRALGPKSSCLDGVLHTRALTGKRLNPRRFTTKAQRTPRGITWRVAAIPRISMAFAGRLSARVKPRLNLSDVRVSAAGRALWDRGGRRDRAGRQTRWLAGKTVAQGLGRGWRRPGLDRRPCWTRRDCNAGGHHQEVRAAEFAAGRWPLHAGWRLTPSEPASITWRMRRSTRASRRPGRSPWLSGRLVRAGWSSLSPRGLSSPWPRRDPSPRPPAPGVRRGR